MHNTMHGCNMLTLLALKHGTKQLSRLPSTELESSDMPGPSGLSSTDPSNEMEHDGKEINIQCDDDNAISSDSSVIPRGVNPTAHAMYES